MIGSSESTIHTNQTNPNRFNVADSHATRLLLKYIYIYIYIYIVRLSHFYALNSAFSFRNLCNYYKSYLIDCFALATQGLAMTNLCATRYHCKIRQRRIVAIYLIRSWLIYFTHCFKSRDLDTSLRINATLSMTIRFGFASVGRRFAQTLWRLQRLAMTIRHRFAQFTRFATFYTTFKGIKMQT